MFLRRIPLSKLLPICILIIILIQFYKSNIKLGAIKEQGIQVIKSANTSPFDTTEAKIKVADVNEVKQCSVINHEHKQYTAVIDGVSYPQYLYLNQNMSINFECLNSRGPTKTILAWNKFYGETNFGYGTGKMTPFRNNHCPVTNCELTMDRSRLSDSDYVILHMSDMIEQEPPKIRPSTQRWIWLLIESPYYTRSFENYNNFFNYTADYQVESEFGNNYESQKRFLWAENTTFKAEHDYTVGKSGFSAALISNCGAANRRLDYINKLKTFVNVDVYGKCGIACPSQVDCREFVGGKYKFFLAFENSICKDYITEKFFLMLKYDVVPVVFGGGNYTRFVPKSGFIDAQDFESAKHLADHLTYLDGNKTAYNAYFQWKKHVNFKEHIVSYGFLCDMCIQLHLEDIFGVKQQVIKDFGTYWNVQKQCKTPSNIPQLANL